MRGRRFLGRSSSFWRAAPKGDAPTEVFSGQSKDLGIRLHRGHCGDEGGPVRPEQGQHLGGDRLGRPGDEPVGEPDASVGHRRKTSSKSPRSKRSQRVLVVFAYTFPGARVILRPHFRVVQGGCRAALFFTERKQQTDGFLARDGVRTVTTSDFHGVFVLPAHTSELWAWAAKTFPLATFDYKERLESLLVEAAPKCGTALRRDDPGYLFYRPVFGGDPLLVARFEPLREGRGEGLPYTLASAFTE